MERVICHWSEGNYQANSTDLEHYHILIEGDGKVRGGDHSILDKVSASDGNYAAHTFHANTGAIGVACCCMVGCDEQPFAPGRQPLKQAQWNVMVQAVAELCQFYEIPVTPTTVLGHGEVQQNLGIQQKGKWDPMVWPWDTARSRAEVGEALRTQVSAALARLARRKGQPRIRVRKALPVDERGCGDTYTLRSAVLAGDATMQKIAATDLVLLPPKHSQRVDGIASIQEALNRLAAAGVPVPRISLGTNDKYRGFYGPQTTRAIRAFQRHACIGVDGLVGDDTLRALDEALLASGLGAPKELAVVVLPKPVAKLLIPAREVPLDHGPSIEVFTRPGARSANQGGGSTTSGLNGHVYQPQPNLQIVEAEEILTATREGKSLGPPRTARQVRTVDLLGKSTRIAQAGYCWSERQLPDAVIFLDHPGFETDAGVLKGEASYFGKFDSTDEGTGTPIFGRVQTNSSVFGVSLPESLLLRWGLAERKGRSLCRTENSYGAQVEIYFGRLRRLARVPIVDVGPQERLRRPADLSVAAAAFLQDQPEEKARGYKLANMQVELRICFPEPVVKET